MTYHVTQQGHSTTLEVSSLKKLYQHLIEPLDPTTCLQKYRGQKNKLKDTSTKRSAKSRMRDTSQRNDPLFLTKQWDGVGRRRTGRGLQSKSELKRHNNIHRMCNLSGLDSILPNGKLTLLRQSGKKKGGVTLNCVDELSMIF